MRDHQVAPGRAENKSCLGHKLGSVYTGRTSVGVEGDKKDVWDHTRRRALMWTQNYRTEFKNNVQIAHTPTYFYLCDKN